MAHIFWLIALLAVSALAAYVVHVMDVRTRARLGELVRERDVLRDELRARTTELIEMKRTGFDVKAHLEPPKQEIYPSDIQEALIRYPAEVRGQTERWIRDQRRVGVEWSLIASRIGAGDDNS